MGIFCCKEEQDNFIEMAFNESHLSEALKREKIRLRKEISRSLHKDKICIEETEFSNSSDTNHAVPKLGGIAKKLENNFNHIIMYQVLEQLEKRFKNEQYRNFLEIKNKFIKFYDEIRINPKYSLVLEKSNDFNDYLNNEKIMIIKKNSGEDYRNLSKIKSHKSSISKIKSHKSTISEIRSNE